MYKTLFTVGSQLPNQVLIDLPLERINQLLNLKAIVKIEEPKVNFEAEKKLEAEILADGATKIKKA